MSESGFDTLETSDVYHKPGRPVRVSATVAPSGHAFVNVRQWVLPEAYPAVVKLAKAGKRQRMDRTAFVDRHGAEGIPDGFHGLTALEPSVAFELAEALVRSAMAAESYEAKMEETA